MDLSTIAWLVTRTITVLMASISFVKFIGNRRHTTKKLNAPSTNSRTVTTLT